MLGERFFKKTRNFEEYLRKISRKIEKTVDNLRKFSEKKLQKGKILRKINIFGENLDEILEKNFFLNYNIIFWEHYKKTLRKF